MSWSLVTVIVVIANGFVAIVAALLMMLVLWQAPRQRANQLFALTMALFMGYGIANGFGRFIEDLDLHATLATYIAMWIYGMFTVCMFFFVTEYGDIRTPFARGMRWFGIGMMGLQTVVLWSDNMMVNIRPTGLEQGSYQGEWTTIGWVAATTSMLFHLVSAVLFYRMKDPRARAFWPAPALVFTGLLLVTTTWPEIPIPFNAVMLALAAIALGRPVLQYELFNPLAQAHAELARRNLEVREASAMKNQFLTNVSYELRTPLNSIIGYTELVLDGMYGALNDTQADRLQKVVRNGHHLLSLINDVLDLNKIEAGELELHPEVIETAALLDNALLTVEPQVQAKELALARRYTDAPPILVDHIRARQIITNVVSNAVKFTHEGGVTVRAFRAADMVQFEVQDTGIGIPQDQFDKVFLEFEQIDGSSTRRYEGTGLGMAITKRLVELHGGRIWLESEVGTGTTFFLTLPCAPQVPVSTQRKGQNATENRDQGQSVEPVALT